MALVTSPQTIPDLNYEYHTITVDTIGQDSANTFTCHLQQPLKNVVQARLLAAHIHSNVVTEHPKEERIHDQTHRAESN